MTLRYPITLPGPISAPIQSVERRLLSSLPGPRQSRAIQRAKLAGQQVEFIFTHSEAAIFAAWVKNDLLEGGAWFSANWPLPQGGAATRRFVGAPAYPSYVPNLGWHVTAQCEVIPGSSEFVCIPWVQLRACMETRAPVLFGSGVYCALDPNTGYIWSIWRSGLGVVRPLSIPAGVATFDGTFVLVYDPMSMTLIDTIRIGLSGPDFMCIVYRNGYMYVGLEGNSIGHNPAYPPIIPDQAYVITKINAATRLLAGVGDTSYGGAVSKLGLISQDKGGLYTSVVNGVGSGTAAMEDVAPFALSGTSPATDWLYNAVYNATSKVRAYTGFGAFIDLRGAAFRTLSTAGWISGTHLTGTRLLEKPCTPTIFCMNYGSVGVIAVNTQTGTIQSVSSTITAKAMYYSPESDTLYVQGTDGGAETVKAYDGSTFAVKGEHPSYVIAQGQRLGNSIYLGCESFVASESTSAPSGRMWCLSFPH